ncbi:SURF1 family protein [Roseomonas terrae]|uniref:SURF1-like protein n=1 Tax=Neoroseomonas terrae TaxID=424799 RepID=A0ABS5EBI5_9PROT|nr:SURF1 family protein [Neoroseomonas terrae]
MTGRSRVGLALFGGGFLLLALLFGALGAWQLQRRAWKHDLIAQVEARFRIAPVPVPGRGEWHLISARDAYRRIMADGQFLPDRETLVRATTVLGRGYWVMVPLQTADGVVMVNRGFIPPDRRDPAARSGPEQGASVRVTGLLRVSEPVGGFLRANDPAADRWYSRDIAAIAARHGLRDVAPFFIDAEALPGATAYPVAGLTVIRFSDHHLVYALTWFGLALLSAWGGVLALRQR